METFFEKLRVYIEHSKTSPVVICVLNRENIKRVEEIIDLSIENGFYVKLNMIYNAGNSRRNSYLLIDFKEYEKAIKKSYNISLLKKYPVYPVHYFIDSNPEKIKCNFSGLCWDSIFYISPEGYLHKCAICEDLNISPFGNLVTDSIEKIHENYLKEKVRFFSSVPSSCTSCQYLYFCGGGCYAFRIFYNGSLNLPSPLCSLTKFLLKIKQTDYINEEPGLYERA